MRYENMRNVSISFIGWERFFIMAMEVVISKESKEEMFGQLRTGEFVGRGIAGFI